LLTVRFNFGGYWTALYCTGDRLPPPPALAHENIYIFAGSPGFDGQFYHYLAHDPLLRQGYWKYTDLPRVRAQRILTPALAYLAAGGQPRLIDPAYLAVTLAFVFLGAFWLSRYLDRPTWGLAFLLVPSVLVSIDRLTADLALAALCVGFLVYTREGPSWKLYLVLAAAGLARETGLVFVGAVCGAALLRREWRRAAVFATAALPALAWMAWLHVQLPGRPGLSWSWVPLYGMAHRLLHPPAYPLAAPVALAAHALDYLALAGTLLAAALALRQAWRHRLRETELATLAFVLPVLFLGPRDHWDSIYNFGRTLAPLPLMLGLGGPSPRSWVRLLPLAMITPRILLQLTPQALGIARALAPW
jgi:hypothetical protein